MAVLSPLVVEVFGPSCAGKSTLIDGLARRMAADGADLLLHDANRPGSRRAGRLHQLRGYTAPGFAAWCAVNPGRAASARGRKFALSLGLSRALHGRPGVHVLDEGPMKRAATLVRGSTAPSRLLAAIPQPGLAVLVTCDFDVRLARLRATGRDHARTLGDAELRARDELRAEGDRWVAEQLGVQLLRLDTTDGQDWSGHVARAIHERMQAAPPVDRRERG